MAEKEVKPRIPTRSPKYVRNGAKKAAPAHGTSRLAKQFIPEAKTYKEKEGFLGLKNRDDNRTLVEKLQDGVRWMREKYTVVFKHRSECIDQHEYECLLITHAVISDFTLSSFIFSLFSEVEELPYIHHKFNPISYADSLADEDYKEKFKETIEELEKIFIHTKQVLKKYIEDDAYFLNAQTRSHTIWFLEHFFKSDIEEPDAPTSGKVVFEVQVPAPIPQEVLDAMGTK